MYVLRTAKTDSEMEKHREGCTGMTKSTAIGPVICSSWKQCGAALWFAQAAAHRLIARKPLREAAVRSGRLSIAIAGGNDEVRETVGSAKQVPLTWVEDATMNKNKQCLQRDVTEVDVSRRGAGRTCLMFIIIPRCMMSTLQ